MRSEWPPGPEVGEGGPSPRPADVEESDNSTTNEAHSSRPPRRWRNARRESALRSTPLGPCGCIRDPDVDRHYCRGISDRQVWGAVAAAHHLFERDLTPIFDVDILRSLWKSGHHQLVDRLRGGGR